MSEFAEITPRQVDLIRRSFDSIWPVRGKLAALFYLRFFELAPDARPLFPKEMERQNLKLMDMIAAIVGAIENKELFRSILVHTGRDHARFGAKPQHFVAFGEALIWGLEQQFGAAFSSEHKDAWIRLYDAVKRNMIEGAAGR
ncbi:MAG: globin domain-containing protein [Xanthobacteraceae bacterium]